jgi:hypothetical protein
MRGGGIRHVHLNAISGLRVVIDSSCEIHDLVSPGKQTINFATTIGTSLPISATLHLLCPGTTKHLRICSSLSSSLSLEALGAVCKQKGDKKKEKNFPRQVVLRNTKWGGDS